MTRGSLALIFVIMFSVRVFAEGTRVNYFKVTKINAVTYGEVLGTFRSRSEIDCARECSGSQQCRSVVYEAGGQTCTTNRYFLEPSSVVSCDLHNNCATGISVQYAEKDLKVRKNPKQIKVIFISSWYSCLKYHVLKF